MIAPKPQRSSFVLVVALLALAVLTVLLLALLQGVSSQMRGSESEAVYAREKMLADSAVALVTSQIAQASIQPGHAWISQPGLIRTYDATGSRVPTSSYKLYSAAQMTDTSGTLAFVTNDVPSDWNSSDHRNLYTDLNTPQTSGYFGTTIYPILDPSATNAVQGVSIDTGHIVEMPVEWLYQLQDGTIGPASQGTKANPIVGRIAFWTDDDTCKIDINTAGCGSPWNTPHVYSSDDVAWSTNQPAWGEYTRYPGHPAMTSLAPVLGNGTNAPSQQLLALTPRYAFGGSEFGTQPTTAGEVVPVKTDRLYASVDELCFGPTLTGSGQRQVNPVSTTQLNAARFVLTAHSRAPETTLLGEPRFAIWPVSDAATDTTRTTPADLGMRSAATIGTRCYLFQRHDATNATNDLTAAIVPDNAKFFSDLVARGDTDLPGYGTHFSQKYPGADWSQIVLEMTDFIRSLNAVDPAPAPFAPFAAADSSGNGLGFVVPLETNYGSGTGLLSLRGLGRCPTLSSLTIVFYVCGFAFDDGTSIDYDVTPDDVTGTSWKANFDPASSTNRWNHITAELVRAFVVPNTFQPGCGYPEVSDNCDIEIIGLNGISGLGASGDFSFGHDLPSHILGEALKVAPADRAWGGNEGPLAWRAAEPDAKASTGGIAYAFAGTHPVSVAWNTNAPGNPQTALAQGTTWPPFASTAMPFVFNGLTGKNALTVAIRDSKGTPLQTLQVELPAFTNNLFPTIIGEYDQAEGSTTSVAPSYYMSLNHRLLQTQANRACMIQAGDISRSVEAGTDLRVIAGLASVPSSLFQPHPSYNLMIPHAHNLRFADGTSAFFADGPTASITSDGIRMVSLPNYPETTASTLVNDWSHVTNQVAYTRFTSPTMSAPTGNGYVSMATNIPSGDWDTGPGLEPDGALINLPDSGTSLDPTTAYFSLSGGQVGATPQRSPNALVPSPVIFGSLPAGIHPANPDQSESWRTLLFCPYPTADTAHPGFATPPDYLILDNFWMPVVEPYAIGTCMATAGKINLNDQIVPFTYLHRNTALRALLTSLTIPAIARSMAASYKSTSGSVLPSIWNPVDADATLAQIEDRFSRGDAYLCESEVCGVPLVPQGQASTSVAATQTKLDAFWNGVYGGGGLTGDNLRELPYAQIYSRLTTRSNSYTVHVRVQVLQKLPADPNQNVWNEGADLVLGDWRGSYEIERYLDPAAQAPTRGQAPGPYKFRIVSSRRFTP